MNENMLRTDGVNTSEIAKDLFDFEKLGVIVLRSFVKQNTINELVQHLTKIRNQGGVYQKLPDYVEHEGQRAIMEMERFCFQNYIESLPKEFINLINNLQKEYALFYSHLAQAAECNKDLNFISLLYYPKGSIGISKHKDLPENRNICSLIVLSGKAPSYFWEKNNTVIELNLNPGDLLLMRDVRQEGEEDHRPYHSMGPVFEERNVMIIRNRIARYPETFEAEPKEVKK